MLLASLVHIRNQSARLGWQGVAVCGSGALDSCLTEEFLGWAQGGFKHPLAEGVIPKLRM